jgi:aminoglycoside phosphotransferase family enzyme
MGPSRRSARSGRAVASSPPGQPDRSAQEKLDFLSDPRHYPDRPARVDIVETHFAWVFLTERYAYKMKKPLQRASMDYATLAKRERACRNELRLNRRLSPGVYLSVVPLVRRRDGGLALGSGRDVADWLVKMRRLPAARMLDRRIAQRTLTPAELDALSGALAAFFGRAVRRPMRPAAYEKWLRRRTLENAHDLRARDLRLNRARISAVVRAQLAFIASRANLLASRGARLLDGHGDLRPEHVCLTAPPCVIDCLEFDRDLRRLDPAEEIAFLGLECERLGASWVSDRLIQGYRAAMHDPVPDALVHFYMSQRAATRAKIAAWHVRDPRYERRRWIVRADAYLSDAVRHARLALDAIQRPPASVIGGNGPLAQQRRKGLARQQALHGLAEQRPDRQRDELVVRG